MEAIPTPDGGKKKENIISDVSNVPKYNKEKRLLGNVVIALESLHFVLETVFKTGTNKLKIVFEKMFFVWF